MDMIAHEHRLLIEAIEAAATATAIYDDRNLLIAWNRAYADIHAEAFEHFADRISSGQLNYEDLIRFSASDLDPENIEAYVAERVAAQRSGTGELIDQYYPGKGWYRITKIRTPSGAVAGFATDITELKETAASLARANAKIEAATAAKTEFVAHMSHEIRTPLNGMLGLARMLSETDLDETQRRYVDAILRSGQMLTRQLNDSLDLAKIESGTIDLSQAPFDPAALCWDVQELYAPIAMEKRLNLTVDAPEQGSTYIGDAEKIQQILNNLVCNAVKFTPAGSITLSLTMGDAGLSFSVTDTGPGIGVEDQHLIFREFAQLGGDEGQPSALQNGGTGLGLTISQRLSGLMGGDLKLHSNLGAGATFTLSLPLECASTRSNCRNAVVSTKGMLRDAGSEGRSLRILIVDDNEVNRFLLTAFLTPLGAELSEAADGAEAVAKFHENAPDFVLMDYHMPVMDGLAACREIREAQRGAADKTGSMVRIYSLSADITPEHATEAAAAGADGILAKPVDFDELTAILSAG